MKILITGAAGFIGSNLALDLCKNLKLKIYGIDNFSKYSGEKIKKIRLKILIKNKNFFFLNLDITQKKLFQTYLLKNKFDIIIHFAAEVGVRYSVINPRAYLETNINGFFNLLETLKYHQPKKMIYASSSSVYGESKKFPLFENYTLKPKNIYALSKKNNEELAEIFSHKIKIDIIGLRFFTVFGEMGRPDMFFFKLLKCIFNKKFFYLNNYGRHYRDFTYIKDVVHILSKLIFSKKRNGHKILNVCSSRPVYLKKMLDLIKKYEPNIRIKKLPADPADVYKTHGSNKKLIKIIGNFKITKLQNAIENTVNWYKKNKINKIN